MYVSGCKVTPTLTSVLLEGSRRGQQRRRRIVVHVSGDADTSTLPAAPSLAGRTRPVSDRTPLNNKRERENQNHLLGAFLLRSKKEQPAEPKTLWWT